MDKKKVYSWAMYDWANSTFSTTVMAGFFPVFFKNYWSQGTDFNLTSARLGTAISLSSLIMALLSPALGAMADLNGYKKNFNFIFMAIGSLCCIWLGFIDQGHWMMAILIFGLALMAFNASCVFYDSLLPDVAQGKDMDYASSAGYSLGYLGGGLLFAINVSMYLYPEFFGLKDGIQAVQYSFISVGLWWFVFTIPLQLYVKESKRVRSLDKLNVIQKIFQSVQQLRRTVEHLVQNKNLLIYLVSYWLFIDGVYTVMTMAVDFGINIGLESRDLISALLLTQFIGFPCAFQFGRVAKKWGCRKPILLCIVIYSVAILLAVQMKSKVHFYMLAILIGMVQGGVQSLSRSLYGQMIPASSSGEYFGLFNLVGRFASILGPLIVGVGSHLTVNPRLGMSSLIILFVVGGFLLYQVREPDVA